VAQVVCNVTPSRVHGSAFTLTHDLACGLLLRVTSAFACDVMLSYRSPYQDRVQRA
jgi:hypothetical protein